MTPIMKEFACCCSFFVCYFICLATVCFTAIGMYLAVNANYRGPLCHIKEFYVPALDLSHDTISYSNNKNNTIVNPCLFFDLAFQNIESQNSVRCGEVNLTFSYGQHAVANYVVPSFDLGKFGTDYRREVVESRGVSWENAVKAVSNGSTVVFRVDLAAQPKFKIGFGLYSKKKDLRIGADVEVGGSGMKVKKEDIRLGFAASKHGVGIFVLFFSLLFTLQCLLF